MLRAMNYYNRRFLSIIYLVLLCLLLSVGKDVVIVTSFQITTPTTTTTLYRQRKSVVINHHAIATVRKIKEYNMLMRLYQQPKQIETTNSNTNNTPKEQGDTSIEQTEQQQQLGTLRVYGPDSKGIVAAFSQVLYGHGCGIFDSEQSTDRSCSLFFQRIHFDYSTMVTDRITLENGIQEVCKRFNMSYELNWGSKKKNICIMISKYDHCLWELLLRHRAGELDCNISLIISNHPDLKYIADNFNIPFYIFNINKDNKEEQEQLEIELMQSKDIDLIILARYMQIISNTFCETYKYRIINIHHSFLPAFMGGRPYHRAHARGVKLIGATAHYATTELDEGPIIEQDITRISHRDEVTDLLRKGRTLEKNVLVNAVKAHIEDRVIVYNNKCVVFGS